MTIRDRIEDFLKQKRLALVGVSRKDADFTRALFREFLRRGYDAVPVNPGAEELDGRRCFHRVQEITPPVDGALLLTKPGTTESVVMDCAAAGIPRIWMYRAVGKGAVSKAAVGFCKSRGIAVIPGFCPHMFWPDAAFLHRLHGFFVKLTSGLAA
ncbi:MAG TPA: CoA-binding protein [Bryobacteraceae bacterium]|nr:CoA-binding protein [Bryobacteraceae bacterium]